jgi:UDP-N-acetylglucosamine/UDP-N-acetylgalactosamine diphosphorylase
MVDVPQDLRRRLKEFGQEHVLAFWDRIGEAERRALVAQLQALNLEELRSLYAKKDAPSGLPAPEHIQSIARADDGSQDDELKKLAGDAYRAGQVAILVVAGGQGSRLGFAHPKGMFPVGPVSNKSLFQIHAEKVLALRRRYGKPIPYLVMTSPATHDETVAYFEEKKSFGLPGDEVSFFQQGTMPALDLKTGRLLLEEPGGLFLSPNGHGGTLTGLADRGLLDRLHGGGVRHIYYFQVDNPLVRIGDPAFLGKHIAERAEVSSKVIPKKTPEEKLGLFVLVDGRLTIIEYSDIPEAMARATDAGGRLRLWAGNPAIHIFDIGFLERVTRGQERIPWHVAKKKVPCLDAQGNLVEPKTENALKFEMFIFDVLPLAQRWTIVPTTRRTEFEPLKNATGADSPESVRRALIALAADWFEEAGVKVPRDAHGQAAFPLEISPLYALDAEELANKLDRRLRIEKPLYLE